MFIISQQLSIYASAHLQSTAHLNSINVIDNNHTEIIGLHHVTQNWCDFLVLATDGCFAEFLFGNFIGQIGAHQNGAWNLQVFGDDVRNECDATAFGNIETFNQ